MTRGESRNALVTFMMMYHSSAGVILTTYAMFSNTANRKNAAKRMIEKANSREWGLLILDEVHLAPAKVFRQVANNIKAHIKLGLTVSIALTDSFVPFLIVRSRGNGCSRGRSY